PPQQLGAAAHGDGKGRAAGGVEQPQGLRGVAGEQRQLRGGGVPVSALGVVGCQLGRPRAGPAAKGGRCARGVGGGGTGQLVRERGRGLRDGPRAVQQGRDAVPL